MSASQRLVDEYLDRLESDLAGVPGTGRREVLDEIRAHIAEASEGLAPDDETGMRNVLERLGEPAEIAAEARERFGIRRTETTWREIGALILLPVGGLILPVVGWFVGVILLWMSDAWSSRDKVIGTLLIPGGLVGPGLLLLLATGSSGGVCHPSFNGGPEMCSGGGMQAWPVVLLVVLVVVPLAAEAYLIWRLQRGARPAA